MIACSPTDDGMVEEIDTGGSVAMRNRVSRIEVLIVFGALFAVGAFANDQDLDEQAEREQLS